jgi:predicted molibdopterin-dependent oxidoreductase YjgC
MTGQLAKVGAGPFSLTGQPNAMGGRELGGLAHLLPGYRSIEDDEARREVEAHWGVPAGSIHPQRGLTTVEMIQAMEQGRIKAIWVAGTNPLVSLPNLALARRAFEAAELVIVQDCYETETTQVADIVLPVAQWIERECTMTNSERRVTRNTRLIDPPGEARPDWWVYTEVAKLMGYGGFDYTCIEEIWDEFRMLTAGRSCDMAGMTNERLREGPLQWPCPAEDHPGTARRYMDKRFATPDGCARFAPACHASPQEDADGEYPLTLTTGRLASQWHTMTRTGKIERLARQAKTPYVEIHEQDAHSLDIRHSDMVTVRSRRGRVMVEAHVSERLRPGMVFMPFHWGDLFAPGQAANNLTNDVLDPVSKEPEFKACAVRLDKIPTMDLIGGSL